MTVTSRQRDTGTGTESETENKFFTAQLTMMVISWWREGHSHRNAERETERDREWQTETQREKSTTWKQRQRTTERNTEKSTAWKQRQRNGEKNHQPENNNLKKFKKLWSLFKTNSPTFSSCDPKSVPALVTHGAGVLLSLGPTASFPGARGVRVHECLLASSWQRRLSKHSDSSDTAIRSLTFSRLEKGITSSTMDACSTQMLICSKADSLVRKSLLHRVPSYKPFNSIFINFLQ